MYYFTSFFSSPNIPKQYLSVQGTVILFSVMDHDKFTSDDFAGEIMLHLPSIKKIEMDYTVDSQPVVMLPLRHPIRHTDGPFQVYICLIRGVDRRLDQGVQIPSYLIDPLT